MHRLHSSQLISLAPLLVGADLDLPAEELVIEEEYGRYEEKMAQEDLDILEETMMLAKKTWSVFEYSFQIRIFELR